MHPIPTICWPTDKLIAEIFARTFVYKFVFKIAVTKVSLWTDTWLCLFIYSIYLIVLISFIYF